MSSWAIPVACCCAAVVACSWLIHPLGVEGTHLVLHTVFVIYPPVTGCLPEATEEKVKLEWAK